MPNSKICLGCKIDKPFSEYSPQKAGKFGYTSRCYTCNREKSKKYNKPAHQRKLLKCAQGICLDCHEPKVSKYYCDLHLKKRAAATRKNRLLFSEKYKQRKLQQSLDRRNKVLEAYGNKCACCGETEEEFLQLDHINNNGAQHRKEIKSRYSYYWLIRNNFPKDNFQLLCANCNWSKQKGVCIHKRRSNGST